MKILLVILALLELFLALIFIGSIFVDRRDLARAVYNYSQEPTEEYKKKLKTEQEITAQMRLKARMILGGLLVANTGGLIVIYRRLKREPKTTFP